MTASNPLSAAAAASSTPPEDAPAEVLAAEAGEAGEATETGATEAEAAADLGTPETVIGGMVLPFPAPTARGLPVKIPNDYSPMAESAHALHYLALEEFEGPLDLLLFLIRRHQIDIFDIPVAFICARYLETLQAFEDLSIDVAAEFMLMAAELIHLKSKMLLPKPEVEGEDEEEGDPRAELVRRLLAYQSFKQAAAKLGARPWLGRDMVGRAPEPYRGETTERLREIGVHRLTQLFKEMLKKAKPEVRHRVVLEQVSLRQTMLRMAERLFAGSTVAFGDLVRAGIAAEDAGEGGEAQREDGAVSKISTRMRIVVTFMAVLEMAKLRLIRVYSSETGLLYLKRRFESLELALEQVGGAEPSALAGEE